MCVLLLVMSALDWSLFATEPHEFQKPFIEDCVDPTVKEVTAFTGLQGGKTYNECDGGYAALYGPHPLMLPEGPRGKTPAEVWLVSKSYSLAEVLFETFRWRTPPEIWATDKDLRQWGLSRGDRFTHYLVPRTNCPDPAPIKLRVRTASDPNALRATNTLILRIEDEFAWWKPLSWMNAYGRGIVTDPKIIRGTTPHGKNHAYRDVAVPGGYSFGVKGRHPIRDPKLRIHTWTSADNPYAKKDIIDRLRRILGKEYAKQELEGLFTDAIGFVFPTFDRDRHMVALPSTDPGDYDAVTAGIDPGWTDVFAGCIWAKYKGDQRWYQVWEFHTRQQQIEDFVAQFLIQQAYWDVKAWQTDKRKPTEIDRLRRLKIKAVPNIDIHRENDRTTIPIMLSVFQGLMQADKIRIGIDHEYTAEEFEKYHYPDPSEDNPKNTNDIPVDYFNHHMDAGRYALCAAVEVPSAPPRYRQGAKQEPSVAPMPNQEKHIPTLTESIQAQDDRMDEAEARITSSARRNGPSHRLRVRLNERLRR